jgi:hypothetical protein
MLRHYIVRSLATACTLSVALAFVPRASGEPTASGVESSIKLTAAVAEAPETTAKAANAKQAPVWFSQAPAQVGDRVIQRLGVRLQLATRITQSGQIAHESTNEMRRQQQRTIRVLNVADDRAVKAEASFQLSRKQSPENETPDELLPQVIEGKTYLATRVGDELTITDPTGATPPAEELKLATESLENIGKPNPLAAALVNRRVAFGELIRVPRDVVQALLGMSEPLGTVHRFELTLVRLEPPVDEFGEVAVFMTDVEIRPNDSSPLSITLHGELAVETETCRLTAVNLSGPVQMSSVERTGGGVYNLSAGGELKLAIRSKYDRVE